MIASLLQKLGSACTPAIGRGSLAYRLAVPPYEAMLNICSLGRGISWSINGVPCRIDARFRSAMGRAYDPEAVEFLKSRIGPGSVCMDIGANLGVYVIQFAAWSGESGIVVAFEPNPVSAFALRKHLRMNSLDHRVRVVEAAVSDTPGVATMWAHACDGMSRLGAVNALLAGRARPIQVPVTTVDAFVAESGLKPNVIFVDIEGFELCALAGARKTLTDRSITLVVEFHPDVWDSAKTTAQSARELMEEIGRRPFPLSGQLDYMRDHGLVALIADR